MINKREIKREKFVRQILAQTGQTFYDGVQPGPFVHRIPFKHRFIGGLQISGGERRVIETFARSLDPLTTIYAATARSLSCLNLSAARTEHDLIKEPHSVKNGYGQGKVRPSVRQCANYSGARGSRQNTTRAVGTSRIFAMDAARMRLRAN